MNDENTQLIYTNPREFFTPIHASFLLLTIGHMAASARGQPSV